MACAACGNFLRQGAGRAAMLSNEPDKLSLSSIVRGRVSIPDALPACSIRKGCSARLRRLLSFHSPGLTDSKGKAQRCFALALFVVAAKVIIRIVV